MYNTVQYLKMLKVLKGELYNYWNLWMSCENERWIFLLFLSLFECFTIIIQLNILKLNFKKRQNKT